MSKSIKTVIPAKAGIQQAKGLVPRLRFPEFREAGDWKEKPLGDCLDYIQPTKYLVSSTDYDDKYPTPVLTAGKTFVLGYTNETKGVFNKNLPVIIFDDFTTASKFVDFPFKGKSSAMKILLAKKGVDIKFIYEAMQLIRYEVGVHERHWISIFSKLSVSVPTHFEEQQKIADCLSSLDALITAQAEKIDALKTHKKGLMQQLFPREGETVPRLRFPEFRDAEEWNVGTIGDVADVSSGGTPNRSEAEYWNGDIPWVSTSLIDFGTIEFANEYITREGLDNSSAKIVPNGTVLMAMYGQGKTRGKVAILGIDAAINQACSAISAKDVVLSEFVFQNLSGRYDEIRKISNPGGQENLSGALIKDISFKFPSIESGEQKKITDCLSSLDSIIAAHSEKLDALKTHKKGLMQQLFPSPEAFGV